MSKLGYHLLIANGGERCICIIEAVRNSNFTDEQKQKLQELYGDYVVTSIHPMSVDCYFNLDIINDIDAYLKQE
jgi:polyphosphate kinase